MLARLRLLVTHWNDWYVCVRVSGVVSTRGQTFKDVPPGLAPKALRMKEAEAMGKFQFDALVAATPRPVPKSPKEFMLARKAYHEKVRCRAVCVCGVPQTGCCDGCPCGALGATAVVDWPRDGCMCVS